MTKPRRGKQAEKEILKILQKEPTAKEKALLNKCMKELEEKK